MHLTEISVFTVPKSGMPRVFVLTPRCEDPETKFASRLSVNLTLKSQTIRQRRKRKGNNQIGSQRNKKRSYVMFCYVMLC